MLSLRFPSAQTGQETKSEVSPPLEEKQTFKVSQDQVINFAVKINFQKNDFMEPSMFRPADSSRFPHFPGALQQSAPILLNLRTTVGHSGHLKPHKIKRNRNMFSLASDRQSTCFSEHHHHHHQTSVVPRSVQAITSPTTPPN